MNDGMNDSQNITCREWPHAPSHLFAPDSAYMVTAATYGKVSRFNTAGKLGFLQALLFEEAERLQWQLQAWSITPNHYHFIAVAPEAGETLADFLRSLHSKAAHWLNQQDRTPGRRVWFQYWDTCLTYERSYLARLHYVHNNPVKHGLTENAEHYPWCSMAWFARNASNGFRKTVFSFKTDRVNVEDDFPLAGGSWTQIARVQGGEERDEGERAGGQE